MHPALVMVLCPVLLLCAACPGPSRGGPSTGPEPVPHPAADRDAHAQDPGHGSPSATVDAGDEPVAAPVSRDECGTLFNRFMSIAESAHAASVAPELVPTPEQLARIRAELEPGFIAACLEFDRATYDCAMRAQTAEQIRGCAGPAQAGGS